MIVNGLLNIYVDRLSISLPFSFGSLLYNTLEQAKKESNLKSYIRTIKKPVSGMYYNG